MASQHSINESLVIQPIHIASFFIVNRIHFCRIAVLILILSAVSSVAIAHFLLNINVRVMHVEHVEHGLRVYLRLPLVFAVVSPQTDNSVSNNQSKVVQSAVPYIKDVEEQGQIMHYLDIEALSNNPGDLGELVLAGHHLSVNGDEKAGSVSEIRVYPAGQQPAFASLNEARKAFSEHPLYPENQPPSYVGDTIIDVLIEYEFSEQMVQYSLTSSLNPGLQGQEQMTNLIFDYIDEEPLVFQQTGILDQPIRVTRESWRSFSTFVKLGVHHILSGMDHLLFVVCLIISSLQLSQLVWHVSAFTVGHMLTLILGVLGYTPTVAWFVPVVESGIAFSIFYVAYLAISNKHHSSSIGLVALFGLLHGLGFSFVLKEIMYVGQSSVWPSLLSFNVGVELGQLLVILCIWPVLILCLNKAPTLLKWTNQLTAAACMVIASYWFVERILLVAEMS